MRHGSGTHINSKPKVTLKYKHVTWFIICLAFCFQVNLHNQTMPLEKIQELNAFHPLHVVPDLETDDLNTMNSDEQFYNQVPVLELFFGEQVAADSTLPTDLELAEFAGDIESLILGKCKVEDENPKVVCDDHVNTHTKSILDNIHDMSKKSMKMLKLDYDGIIAGWSDNRSLWIVGNRQKLNPNHFPPDCMVGCDNMLHCHSGDTMMASTKFDVEREARVSRYKGKGQTMLFSKKIMYTVRKLNAEKRPRMKGRFVKRTSFAS